MSGDGKKWLEFNYAWKWFEYHASQRLVAFRFYLIIISAIGWLFCKDNTVFRYPKNLFMGLMFLVVSIFFFFLEIRNNQLVNCGRDALDNLEEEMEWTGTKYAIRENDKKSKICCVSHSFVIRAIYSIVGAGGLIFVGMSFCCK